MCPPSKLLCCQPGGPAQAWQWFWSPGLQAAHLCQSVGPRPDPRGLGGHREVGKGGCSAPDRPARRFSISGRNSKSQASHCTLIKPKRGQWKEKGGDGKNYPQRRRSGGRGKKESLGPAEPPGTEHCILAHFSFPSPATPPSRAANRCPPKK